ncbi:hypothetical protein BDW22DRAFT_1407059 [Trametopsis cervina]|nr:hypothetical protein BDW22DRAFT_1407059 [Trametopsis cervina]
MNPFSVWLCLCDLSNYFDIIFRSARVLFKAGKTRDGYFTNEDIITQATSACDILDKFHATHPNQKHKLAFDNATNHRKRRENALSTRYMHINMPAFNKPNFLCAIKGPDGNVVKVPIEDTRFHDGTVQSLYYPVRHQHTGQFKGMQQLVWERYERSTPGIPNPMETHSPTSKQFKIKGECKGFKCPEGMKSILEEVCEAHGYEVLFYLKFHCELNFIEQVWGYAKHLYREFPASSNEEALEQNVVAAIDTVPINISDRFLVHLLRFMDVYRKGLNEKQMAWANQKYHGHCVLPDSIFTELQNAKLILRFLSTLGFCDIDKFCPKAWEF